MALTATLSGKVLLYKGSGSHQTSVSGILGDFGQVQASGTGDKDPALCFRYKWDVVVLYWLEFQIEWIIGKPGTKEKGNLLPSWHWERRLTWLNLLITTLQSSDLPQASLDHLCTVKFRQEQTRNELRGSPCLHRHSAFSAAHRKTQPKHCPTSAGPAFYFFHSFPKPQTVLKRSIKAKQDPPGCSSICTHSEWP